MTKTLNQIFFPPPKSEYFFASEFCKHVRDRAGVMESIAGVSGRSVLDHIEFTDVRFGMRVPDTASLLCCSVSMVWVQSPVEGKKN
jgi:hypothetical protein